MQIWSKYLLNYKKKQIWENDSVSLLDKMFTKKVNVSKLYLLLK